MSLKNRDERAILPHIYDDPPLEMEIILINEFYSKPCNSSIYRDYKNCNYFNLYQTIKSIDWNLLYKTDNIEEKVLILTEVITKAINNNIPTKNSKLNKFPKWFSPYTITAIKNKNKFRKLFKKTKTSYYQTKFRLYRVQAKHLIKEAFVFVFYIFLLG